MPDAVHVLDDEPALAQAVAVAMRDSITSAVQQRGTCSLALSGGSTPRRLYRTLAAEFRDRIPWRAVDIFWSDERFVPATDSRSNYGMARTELLDHLPRSVDHVHPVPTHLESAAAAADAYQATLRKHFDDAWPRFDLILLGIGEDCHTASLFPHSSALAARDRLVVSVAESNPPTRVSLTMPVLLAARTVFVLATGRAKAAAVARARMQNSIDDCPASALRHSAGEVVWWLDSEAAGR
jgi:6-phosphogluconolactonase